MKNIKVLGSGCKKCHTTFKLIDDASKQQGVKVELEKIEDMAQILAYGVLATPGVVIDDQVVHMGSIPTSDKISQWLNA